jgi:hypothetical protein
MFIMLKATRWFDGESCKIDSELKLYCPIFADVKRFLIYILLLLIGTSALTFDQFDKLPLFLKHFKVHCKTDPDLNLFTFVSMHYLGHDLNDNDSAEDMKLPFKKIDTQSSHVLFCNNNYIELAVNCNFLRPLNAAYKNSFYPNPALATTFRPPCI